MAPHLQLTYLVHPGGTLQAILRLLKSMMEHRGAVLWTVTQDRCSLAVLAPLTLDLKQEVGVY